MTAAVIIWLHFFILPCENFGNVPPKSKPQLRMHVVHIHNNNNKQINELKKQVQAESLIMSERGNTEGNVCALETAREFHTVWVS